MQTRNTPPPPSFKFCSIALHHLWLEPVHVTLLCITSDRNLHACHAGLVSSSEVMSVIFLESRRRKYHHLLPFLKWFQRLVEFYVKTMSPYLWLVSPPYMLLCTCVWDTTVTLSRGSAFIHWWSTLFRTCSYPGPTEHKNTPGFLKDFSIW